LVFERKIGVGDYPSSGGELDKSSMFFETVQGENLDHEIEILLLVLEDYDHYFDHLRHGKYCFSSKLDARWTINGVQKSLFNRSILSQGI